jgi:hypothetical protein
MTGYSNQIYQTLLMMMLTTSHAFAYVPTMTCNEGADPASDPYACLEGDISIPISWSIVDDEGLPIPVSIFLNETGSADLVMEDIDVALTRSIAEWTTPSCTALEIEYGGTTPVDQIGYNFDNPEENINILYFYKENWPFQSGMLALTATSYRNSTGEILDADIRINDQFFTFSTTDNPEEVMYDLRNMLTHESGHLLGLDENPDYPESTMYPGSSNGELVKRDLSQDDIIAICDTYPAEGYIPTTSFEPSPPNEEEDSGCQQNTEASSRGFSLFIVMLLLGVSFKARINTKRRGSVSSHKVQQYQKDYP